MPFDSETAAIRFGTGLSPKIFLPQDSAAMLATLHAPDAMAARYPIPRFQDLQPTLSEIHRLKRLKWRNKGTPVAADAQKKIRAYRGEFRRKQAAWLRSALLRGVYAPDGLRERLTWFWADHFTVRGKSGVLRSAVSPYVEEAIRPHLAGRFSDMLRAVVLHPMMLQYLDQSSSAGPNSPAARRKGRGLNENLGRELLELHTLGVGGAYDQHDVRALSKLLTGLSYRPDKGFVFVPAIAEPGVQTVLGHKYGGTRPTLARVLAFLEDVALYPDTAHHLARQLVVHFVSDTPDGALVDHVAAAYSASGGDLSTTYAALLAHPAAWVMPDRKAKRPFHFMVSALRATGVDEGRIKVFNWKQTMLYLGAPMALMGQRWQEPNGPDGWPEEVGAWITPQGLAARIQWAMIGVPHLQAAVPDPRAFVATALGARANAVLHFAAGAAETRAEGIGIVLSSPQFQKS